MNKTDQALHKGLMKVLNEATFEMKVREVQTFIDIYNWANNLPNMMKKQSEAAPVKKKKKTSKKV